MAALAKLTDRFTEARLDDEIVIMRLDNGEFFALSGTAATIWRLIDEERDSEALVAAVAAEYKTSEGDLAGEVQDFLQDLEGIGLLARG
jgi:hypothetical protein